MHRNICGLDPAERAAGVLVHPTSLPNPFGVGGFGPETHRLIGFLGDARIGLWQMLPLGPTGFGDSPYQSFSSFAGNPLLVSLEVLHRRGLLDDTDLAGAEAPDGPVDFAAVHDHHDRLLELAWRRFAAGAVPGWQEPFDDFVRQAAPWLEDHALFIALKETHDGAPWADWEPELRDRRPEALDAARRAHAGRMAVERFIQFVFFTQLDAVRAAARRAEVRLVGDLPFYVAWDSSDVWARQDLFQLDAEGRPRVVAGVPPDYFSPTGQLWGNPIYAWARHAAEGYRWWTARIARLLRMVDIIRIDHFRAFADYWEVPGAAPTAETGRWLPGPGLAFFTTVTARLGPLPVIAEDLGELSPAVPALLEATGFPGMRILQFAFDSDMTNPFLPHNHPRNAVAYTGTHDNDTTLGWWATAPDAERAFAGDYLGVDGTEPVGAFVRAVWASPAMFALVPLQDVLRLGSEARMNTPGTVGGRNWRWRLTAAQFDGGLFDELAALGRRHRRTMP